MNNEEKNCPYCGETIKSIAIKCKHCQSDISLSNFQKKNESNFKVQPQADILNFKIYKISWVLISCLIFLLIILSFFLFLHYTGMEKKGMDFFGNKKINSNNLNLISSNSSTITEKTAEVKFPIRINCTGDLKGMTILITEKQVLFTTQKFDFIKQSGTWRTYKDSINDQILTYDLVSDAIMLSINDGQNYKVLTALVFDIEKNCKKI